MMRKALLANGTDVSRTPVLILAGGEGHRLFPLTLSRPKPAIPFGGSFRIIDFPLLNCLHSELTDVSLLTQYRHEQLEMYIRQIWSERWEQSCKVGGFLRCLPPAEGERYKGTADAALQNLAGLVARKPQHVLILSGDHVYRMNYRSLLQRHAETDADVTISTIECPLVRAKSFGVVEVDSHLRATGFREKPAAPRPLRHQPGMARVSMGVYVFKLRTLVEALCKNYARDANHDFGRDIIPSLLGSAEVYAYDFRDEASNAPGYWRDIGTIDSYYRASMDLVQPNPPSDLQRVLLSDHRSDPRRMTSLSGSARISRTTLSSGVTIQAGAEIEDSVLMPGVQVGAGAKIRRAIIEEDVRIPAGFTVGFDPEYDRRRHWVSSEGVAVVGYGQQWNKPNFVSPERITVVPPTIQLARDFRVMGRTASTET